MTTLAFTGANPHLRDDAKLAILRARGKGLLEPQPCVVCGDPAEGHHEDYGRPLDLTWLCRLHHSWRHRYGQTVDEMRAEIVQ